MSVKEIFLTLFHRPVPADRKRSHEAPFGAHTKLSACYLTTQVPQQALLAFK